MKGGAEGTVLTSVGVLGPRPGWQGSRRASSGAVHDELKAAKTGVLLSKGKFKESG